MAISFNQVPSNILVPMVTVEFDSSRAQQGPAQLPFRALLVGQKTSAGTATADKPVRVTNPSQVMALAGRGSMLHRMAVAWFANNAWTETWILPVSDNGSGVAAVKSVEVGGTATAAGTISLYVGGRRVQVGVASGDAKTVIATNLAAAITADLDGAATAAVVDDADDDTVAITHRHKGVVGTTLDVRHSYADGEALPAGVTLTISSTTAGTGNPTLTSALAALGDTWFHVIAHPYTDSTSLTAIETELARRNGPLVMADGLAVTATAANHSDAGTLGDSRNSPHSVIMATNQSPTPVEEFAAAVAANIAYYGNIDPARPFQTLPLSNVLPPSQADEWTKTERNLLLYDGIGTTTVAAGGVVQIERPVTTYKTNAAGAPDIAYRDATTLLTLMYLRFTFRNRILTKYPRHKLLSESGRIGSGQAYITPKVGKAEAVAWFGEMEVLGLVENLAQFKRDLIVERNVSDPNRLDFLLPADLVNFLAVAAVQIQFRL